MQLIHSEELTQWLANRRVGLHATYKRPTFTTRDSASRFWLVPPARQVPHFLSTILEAVGKWSTCLLYRDPWTSPLDAPQEKLVNSAIVAAGIPEQHRGGVVLQASEHLLLMQLLFMQLVLSTYEDLDVVFDSGEQILSTDHHEVLHVHFPHMKGVMDFVAELAARKYRLPEQPPDWTFHWPDWMGPCPDDWPSSL